MTPVASTPLAAGGKSLPPELLFLIIAQLTEEVTNGRDEATIALAKIARCSKETHKPAIRPLYRRIKLDERTFPIFLAPHRRHLLQNTESIVVDEMVSRATVLDTFPPNLDEESNMPAPYLTMVYTDVPQDEPYVEEWYIPPPPLGALFPNLKTVTFTERAVLEFTAHDGRSALVAFEDGESEGCPPPAHIFEETLATLAPQHVCATLQPPKKFANIRRHHANLQPSHEPSVTDWLAETPSPDWLLRLTNRWQPQSMTVHNCALGHGMPKLDGVQLRIWPTDTVCNADGEHDPRLCALPPPPGGVMDLGEVFTPPEPDHDPANPPFYDPITERHPPTRVEIPALLSSHFRFAPCAIVQAWTGGLPYAVTMMARQHKVLEVPPVDDVSPCVCCGARVVDGRGIKPDLQIDGAEAVPVANPTS